jgi:hypothetical protein
MPPLTRRSSAAGAAGKRPAANPADYAEVLAAKRARAPAAAAANEPAAGEPARPSNDAVYGIVRTRLLGLPAQERAGFLEESSADDPEMLAAVRNKFADLLAEPVAEPATDTANAAAREAAEAAAKKIEDLRTQLAAEQAKNVAVRLRGAHPRAPYQRQSLFDVRVWLPARGDGLVRSMEGRNLGLERRGFADGGGRGRGELGGLLRLGRLTPHGLVGGDRFRLLRGELGAEGHDLLVGRFRGFANGGIRFHLFGNELGAEVRDLLGGRLCCFAGGGIGSVRNGLRLGLRQQAGELVAYGSEHVGSPASDSSREPARSCDESAKRCALNRAKAASLVGNEPAAAAAGALARQAATTFA